MRISKYILLYEDFEALGLCENLEDKLKKMKDAKKKYADKMQTANIKAQESAKKAANFKERAGNTDDPLTKKIYSNRASEEMMQQQIYAVRLKAMQMETKLNDLRISTTDLKITQREKQGK
jgi:hypothetical protein